ncbi:hypothetical protein NC77_20355 [Janthinobacterium lividum]|uniref:hypothetical protein n=1 Tax=Janthinobacterium lividum TaxID=29581 RepID=UPI0005368031|nr:hypothetical protein [Janthinobacterium lividum]KHA77244.1 hypothetical protein NC77_20355 [Janthinobacterium lividum]
MSAKPQVEKYFQALQRLIDRRARINSDAVAIEAGSGRGSIKKSRAAYTDLIAAIDAAALKQEEAADTDPVSSLKEQKTNLVRMLDGALEREVALLSEVYDLREEVRQLREQMSNMGLVLVPQPTAP